MAAYTLTTKVYEHDEWDEENDMPIVGKVESYSVFSTIQINKYTFVRAVMHNKTARPARANARQWFVEWKVSEGVINATHRLTPRMTREEALREGERAAALIAEQAFASVDDALEFFRQHIPSGPTYGH
jgi:hypothetical protein